MGAGATDGVIHAAFLAFVAISRPTYGPALLLALLGPLRTLLPLCGAALCIAPKPRDVLARLITAGGGTRPPPPPGGTRFHSGRKMKFIEGTTDLGHFWYMNSWVGTPRPPSSLLLHPCPKPKVLSVRSAALRD